MKTIFAGLALGALACAASGAQTASTINATGFSLSSFAGASSEALPMTLISETNETTVIGLGNLLPQVNNDPWQEYSTNSNEGFAQLVGHIQHGYRITGLSLSGVAYGEMSLLELTSYPGFSVWPGEVSNSVTINWSLATDGAYTPLQGIQMANIKGNADFESGVDLSMDEAFRIDIDSLVTASGRETIVVNHPDRYTTWLDMYPNWSMVRLSDVTLTVQVSAVPEPGTYTMLLAGLAVFAFARRKAAMQPVRS